MNSVLLFQFLVVIISLTLSIVSLVFVLLQPETIEQITGIVFIFFSILMSVGYLGILKSDSSLPALVFATKIKYFGSLSVIVSVVLETRIIFKKIPKWFLAVNILVMIFLCLIIGTFDEPSAFSGKWLFKSYEAVILNGIPYLKKEYAWGHSVYVGLSVVYSLILTALFVRNLIRRNSEDDFAVFLLYIVNIIPTICYIAEKIYIHLNKVEPIPLVPSGFVVADFFFIYMLAVKKLSDVNRVASDEFFESIDCPAMIISSGYIVTKVNNSVKKYFPEISESVVGENAIVSLPVKISDALKNCIAETMIESSEENKNEYINKNINEKFGETRIKDFSFDEQQLIHINNIAFQPKLKKIQAEERTIGYIFWLENVTPIHEYKLHLESEVRLKTEQLVTMRDQMVLGFASLAEHHDLSLNGHLKRTAVYVQILAQTMYDDKIYSDEIDQNFVFRCRQVAPLHDIGKNYIDEKLLDKSDKLSEEEYAVVQSHTTLGAAFIEENLIKTVDPLYYQMAHDIVLYHHEWWNGTGYPQQLSGRSIPLVARIMAVADCWDALTTVRPYKNAFTNEDAFNMIVEQSGTHFDPEVINAFKKARVSFETVSDSQIQYF